LHAVCASAGAELVIRDRKPRPTGLPASGTPTDRGARHVGRQLPPPFGLASPCCWCWLRNNG
jgi:hypothetical protein